MKLICYLFLAMPIIYILIGLVRWFLGLTNRSAIPESSWFDGRETPKLGTGDWITIAAIFFVLLTAILNILGYY